MRRLRVLVFVLLMAFLFCGGAFGEVVPSSDDIGQLAEAPTEPIGPHWRFVSTYCEGFKPINDPEHGVSWGGEVLPGSIQATYTTTDRTDVNHPIELKSVFNWGWQIDPIPEAGLGDLYPGNEVKILMSLGYTGLDPDKYGGYAEMYAGVFQNYPQDNNLLIGNPGGTLEKEITIEIPEGIEAGQQSTIDIVCTGSVPHKLVYYYVYEWVA